MLFLIRGSVGFKGSRDPDPCAAKSKVREIRDLGSLTCARHHKLLACGDDQIRLLVIPSVTKSEVERRRIGLLIEFLQPLLIMLFEHIDGPEINAKETQIPLVRIEGSERNA